VLDAGDAEGARVPHERQRPDHPGLPAPRLASEVEHQLGRVHAVLGRPRRAVYHALRAVRILERHRISVPPDEYMAAFLRDKHAVFENAVFFVLWLGGRRSRERAFETAERAKGRALLDLLQQGGRRRTSAARDRDVRRAGKDPVEVEAIRTAMPPLS
jgi:hypothetical protein